MPKATGCHNNRHRKSVKELIKSCSYVHLSTSINDIYLSILIFAKIVVYFKLCSFQVVRLIPYLSVNISYGTFNGYEGL